MVPPKDGFAQSSPDHNNNYTSSITYKRKMKVLEKKKHLPSPNNLKYITTKPLSMLLSKHNNASDMLNSNTLKTNTQFSCIHLQANKAHNQINEDSYM
jgi:hypothetical protein